MVGMDILSKSQRQHLGVEPGSIRNRYHLIQQIGKAASIRSTAFKDGARKPAADETIRKAAVLTLVRNENRHAVRLARNLRSGSDDSDSADRHPCRSSSYCPSQSGAAVRLHRRLRGLAQRPRLG